MEEKRIICRCHPQQSHLPHLHKNYKKKRKPRRNPKNLNFGPLLDAGRSLRCTAGDIYRCRRLQSPGRICPRNLGSGSYQSAADLRRFRGTFVASGHALWRVASPGPSMWAFASGSSILALYIGIWI